MVAPQCSAHFLRERIAARIPAAIAALRAPDTEHEPERAEMQLLLSELPEGGRYSVFTLIEELEWFPARGDLESVARQMRLHASSPAKAAELVQLVCEWCVTRHRPAHHRKLLGATLIRKFNALIAQERQQVDGEEAVDAAKELTQSRLHIFLDTFDCHSSHGALTRSFCAHTPSMLVYNDVRTYACCRANGAHRAVQRADPHRPVLLRPLPALPDRKRHT